ncbi:hypothetical protein BX616_011281 [Lobosporangium transversale]|nr:hypothetical protein BX616_011281 [Lobosporangium transversale]
MAQGQDSDGFAGYGEIILYKDGDDHNDASAKLNEPYVVDVERFTGAYVQPIEGIDIHDDGKLKRFAVMVHTTSGLPMIGISLDEPTFGNTTVITYGINITDSYGVPLNLPESNTTDTITGALIGGGLALSALTIYLFVCWQWPQWQRWLINRIVEILTADGGDADEHNHRRKQRLPEAGETNKVEDPLIHSYDFDGGDKILVIDDEMSTNLKNNPIVYVQDVPLERHPRPSFVTTLNSDQGISDYTSRTAVNHTNGSTSRAIHVQGSEKHGVLSRVSIVGEAIIATTRRSVATAILQTSSLSSAEASSKSSDDIGKSDGVGMALSASKPRALRLPLLRHQPSAPVLKFSNGNSSNSDKASTITSSESEETPLASIEGTTTTIVRSNHCNSIEKIELPTPFLATPTLLMPPLLPPPQSSMGLNQRRTSVYSISPAYVPEEAAPPYYLHQYPSQSITPQQQASKQLSQLSSPLQTPEPTQLFQFPQEKHQNLSQLLLSVPTPSFPTPPIPSAPTLDFRGHDLGQEYRQSRGYDQESEKGCLASSPQAKLPSEIFQTPKSSFDLQMNTSKPNPSSSTILGEQKVLSQGEDDTQVLGSEMEE